MPQLSRPKIPAIYNTVALWHNHGGGVNYVAHAITAGPAAVQLRPLVNATGVGGSPASHPDQLYWASVTGVLIPAIQNMIVQAGGAGAILRIEIDCTLMPCNGGVTSCMRRVPQLVQSYGFAGISLRIFSHRDEGVASAGQSSKRVISTTSGATGIALDAAYNAHTDWSWAPWNGVYP